MDVRGADLKSKIKRLEMLEEKYSFNFLPIAVSESVELPMVLCSRSFHCCSAE